MTTYQVTKPSPISNSVVTELNAYVLTATFKNSAGVQLADLYSSDNGASKLVAHGTCSPVNSKFEQTIKIQF